MQTENLLSIILNDILLFLGDVGGVVITLLTAIQSLFVGIWCLCTGIITSILNIFATTCNLAFFTYSSVVNAFYMLLAQIGNVFMLIKHFIILFGSSVMFSLSIIPKFVYFLSTELVNLLAKSYFNYCLITASVYSNVKLGFNSAIKGITNYLYDIPPEALLGSILGILIIISLTYLLNYMIENVIIIPDIPTPSFLISLRRWFLRVYVNFTRRPPPPLQQNDTEEEDFDMADENGNDNNDNVPDLNLPQNQNYFVPNLNLPENRNYQVPNLNLPENRNYQVPNLNLPENRNFQIPNLNLPENRNLQIHNQNLPENVDYQIQNDNNYHEPIIAGDEVEVIPTVTARPSLARRPVTRSQRQLIGLPEDIYEQDIHKASNSQSSKNQTSLNNGDAKKIYDELEKERDSQLCIVCQDNKKCVILLPCRHLCLCKKCKFAILDRDNACPVCRQDIHETLNVFV